MSKLIGLEIKILVNEEKLPGYYSIVFDRSDLSGGVYFYELITNKKERILF
jgi:hypothetical protein